MAKPTIYLAADHGGFEYKNKLAGFLTKQGYKTEDLGANSLDPKDDYPDFAFPLAEKIAKDPDSLGIMLCRGGQGMAIAANKVKNVRAVVCWNKQSAIASKNDNAANVLSLPADDLTLAEIKTIVATWLATPFSTAVRHRRRVAKIKAYEK